MRLLTAVYPPPDPPIDIDPDALTFDEDVWHPLEHVIGSPLCLGYQPSWRRSLLLHLTYTWHYVLYARTRALTTCRLGGHLYVPSFGPLKDGAPYLEHVCQHCEVPAPRSASDPGSVS